MCILFIAKNQHPQYPLIICANRDEFHQRPTQNMHWWPAQSILAGKDLQAGGTWLGLNKNKQFAALTNYRNAPMASNKRSRGELVVHALTHNVADSTQFLQQEAQQYQAFNLLYGDINTLYCFNSMTKKQITINTGFHSICNGDLDELWPKMQKGIDSLAKVIKKTEHIDIEQLFSLMSCQIKAQPEKLPKTGISFAKEQLLSSIFITSPDYGTRSTCVILVDPQAKITVYEQSYNNKGQAYNHQQFIIK